MTIAYRAAGYPFATVGYDMNRLPDKLEVTFSIDSNGIVNVGIGGKAETLRARGDRLKRHWGLLVEKLDRLGLVRGHTYHPRGYAYHVLQAQPEVRRGNALIAGDAVGLATLDMGEGIGPAVRSGLLAAEAILHDSDYDLSTIPRVSLLPSLQRLVAARRPP